jgi:hypothetical protein
MKQAMWVAVFAVAGAGVAAAQEDRKLDELKREFERSMKGLQEKFEAEKGRLEKEFKAAVGKLKGAVKPEPKKDEGGKESRPGLEQLVEKLIDRVDRLEKKLEGFGGLYRGLPKDFDFKRFGDFKDWTEMMPPRFREFMEKRGEDKEFRFDFKVPPGKKKDEEEKEEKKPQKKKDKKEEDSF